MTIKNTKANYEISREAMVDEIYETIKDGLSSCDEKLLDALLKRPFKNSVELNVDLISFAYNNCTHLFNIDRVEKVLNYPAYKEFFVEMLINTPLDNNSARNLLSSLISNARCLPNSVKKYTPALSYLIDEYDITSDEYIALVNKFHEKSERLSTKQIIGLLVENIKNLDAEGLSSNEIMVLAAKDIINLPSSGVSLDYIQSLDFCQQSQDLLLGILNQDV